MAKIQKQTYVSDSLVNSTAGRGLFSSSSLSAGQLILSQTDPLLLLPENAQLHQVCEQCFDWVPNDGHEDSVASLLRRNPGRPLKACLGCHVVFYCGKACQSKSWKSHHKYECNLYHELKQQGKVLPAVVRATIQLLDRKEKGKIDDSTWNSFMQLQSHRTELYAVDQKRMEIELVSQGVKGYSGSKFDLGMISEIFCRLLINAHTLTAPAGDPIGICVDPIASMLNHSCEPNTFLIFDGRHLSLRSLYPISKASELTISYIDSRDERSKRQEILRETYFFNCKCIACSETRATTEDQSHLNTRSQSRLAAIISKVPKEFQENLDQFRLTEMEPPYKVNNKIYISLENLLTYYIEYNQWPLGLEVSTYIHEFIECVLFPQPWHPVRMTMTWKRAMMMLDWAFCDGPGIAKIEDVYSKVLVGLIGEVRDNVDKTHEPGSAFSKMVYQKCDELRRDFESR